MSNSRDPKQTGQRLSGTLQSPAPRQKLRSRRDSSSEPKYATRRLRRETHQFTRQTRFSIEAAWLDTLISSGIPRQLASDMLSLTLSAVRGFSVRMLIENDPEQFTRLMNVWRGIIHQHLAVAIPKPRRQDRKS